MANEQIKFVLKVNKAVQKINIRYSIYSERLHRTECDNPHQITYSGKKELIQDIAKEIPDGVIIKDCIGWLLPTEKHEQHENQN